MADFLAIQRGLIGQLGQLQAKISILLSILQRVDKGNLLVLKTSWSVRKYGI